MLSFEENLAEHCWNVMYDGKCIANLSIVNGMIGVVPCDTMAYMIPYFNLSVEREFRKFKGENGGKLQ